MHNIMLVMLYCNVITVSRIFSFDFSILTNFFDFDQEMMKMMPILPINSSTFGQMGIYGVAPTPFYVLQSTILNNKT